MTDFNQWFTINVKKTQLEESSALKFCNTTLISCWCQEEILVVFILRCYDILCTTSNVWASFVFSTQTYF